MRDDGNAVEWESANTHEQMTTACYFLGMIQDTTRHTRSITRGRDIIAAIIAEGDGGSYE